LKYGELGSIEKDVLNIVRKQMGNKWGQIMSHAGKTIGGVRYVPFDQSSFMKIGLGTKPVSSSLFIGY